jgi:Flp pilus assembly protein TadG
MPPPIASTVASRNIFDRFRRNSRGSAAVEFALVAPIFFALLFAILETALMFLAGQVLETATESAARQIQTGQAQGNAAVVDAGTFLQNYVCTQLPALFTCSAAQGSNVWLDVKSYSSFQTIPASAFLDPITGGNLNTATFGYSLGNSCDVVVVRLYYKWQLFVTGLGYNIANLNNQQRALSATAVFRNEPYSGACS